MKARIEENWNSLLSLFPDDNIDIYYQEDYVRLYETNDHKAVSFLYIENNDIFLFPFLRREFIYNEALFYDFETAYGYGGPIYNTKDEQFIVRSWMAMFDYCRDNRYVAGFARFHPLLRNFDSPALLDIVTHDRQTIAMDLTLTEGDIWLKEISGKNRNSINKSVKSKLQFVADFDFRYIDEFKGLYKRTMDRLKAQDFYFFEEEYFSDLYNSEFAKFLGIVIKDDLVIAGAIIMHSKYYGHYHLAASDPEYFYSNPNNYLVYECSKVLKSLGVQRFHLGGGSSSLENDSLYKFKKKFSQSTFNFYTGRFVFDEAIYKNLCRDWISKNSDKVDTYKAYHLKYKH